MEKQDSVKKNQLCRKCLKHTRVPHLAKDCKAPNCAKCGGDHNTLICNNPTGKQELHAIAGAPTGNLYGDGDIYGEQNVEPVQALALYENQQFLQKQAYEQHMMQSQVFDQRDDANIWDCFTKDHNE